MIKRKTPDTMMRDVLPIAILALAGLTPARSAPAPVVTHLFTSWYGIDAGTAVFKANRQDIDPDILPVIDKIKGYYKIELADGDFPPERVNVPTGIKVRAEVATKSEPWLKSEKPWETG